MRPIPIVALLYGRSLLLSSHCCPLFLLCLILARLTPLESAVDKLCRVGRRLTCLREVIWLSNLVDRLQLYTSSHSDGSPDGMAIAQVPRSQQLLSCLSGGTLGGIFPIPKSVSRKLGINCGNLGSNLFHLLLLRRFDGGLLLKLLLADQILHAKR